MRAALSLLLLVSLAGCSTLRGLAGEAQKVGDKGIGVQSAAVTQPVDEEARARALEMPALPPGLAGDTANRSHTPQL